VFLVLASVCLFLDRERAIAHVTGFPLDDSWIHAVFARNVASGQGFSFNPGEQVAGSTAPLYTLLVATLYKITGEFVWTEKILGVLCQAASAVLIFFTMLAWEKKAKVRAFLAAAIVALSPPLLWAALSGMEIPLYLLLVCLGLYFRATNRPILMTLFWAIGVWVRPDGIFLLLLGLALTRKDRWKQAAVAGAIVGAFFLFNLGIGGTIFPQTVGAKAHLGLDPLKRTWNLMREWGALWGVPYRNTDELEQPVLLLIGLLAGAWALRQRQPLLWLYALGLPIVLSLFREESGSGKRYILYVIPFGAILAAYGFEYLSKKILRERAHQSLIVAGTVAILWQGVHVAHKATQYGWNVQNIDKMQGYLGRLSKFLTNPGDRIATNDIGAIGYYSERPIVDLVGLVTPAMSLPQALTRYQPELLIIFVDWFKDYAEYDPGHDTFLFWDADSTHRYAVVAGVQLNHNTICSKDQMLLFKRFPAGVPLPARRLLRRF
jgi:arabinofuranosyltransferase